MNEEDAELRMMEHFHQRISDPEGWVFGQKLTQAEYTSYVQQYEALKARVDAREAEKRRLAVEEERVRLEGARLLNEREVEHRRLDIEEERVKIEKANVLLKAISIAAEKGADPNKLLETIQGLGQHLLPGSELRLPALTEREEA